jgi:hypothetical protein
MILVPTLTPGASTAELALDAEGVTYQSVDCRDDDYAYGRALALAWHEAWRRSVSLVVLEHDIAPWPGAIAQLEACEELLCGHEYPQKGALDASLGLTKFSYPLLERAQHAPVLGDWKRARWFYLDAVVFETLQKHYDIRLRRGVTPMEHMHVHTPAVAHARRIGR